jgi:hypothetical protein
MKSVFLALSFLGFYVIASAQLTSAPKPISSPATLMPRATPASSNDSGPMPFSNEEANFYRRAWPVEKSHSIFALILYGSVVVILLTLIVRKMAQSGPRKPPQQ